MGANLAMRRFRYNGILANGTQTSGSIVGSTAHDVDAVLADRGIHTLTVTPDSHRPNRASRQQLAVVFRSIATLLEAGLPLPLAIATTENEVAAARLRPGLADALRLVLQGESLADAVECSLCPPSSVVGLLRFGELSGHLEMALAESASQLEAEASALSGIRKAVAYPAVLVVAGGASMFAIVYWVLPRFTALLVDSGQPLPTATRVVLGGADLVREYGLLVVVVLLLSIVGLMQWSRTTKRLERVYAAFLEVPLLGPIRSAWIAARLTRVLGAQLSSGLPLLRALEITRAGISDPCIETRLRQATEEITRGIGLSSAFRAARLLPSSIIPLITIGESSGKLGPMLLRSSEICSREVDRRLAVLVGMLEPGLVVILGGGVAILAAAMLQAVYALRP